MRSGIILDLDGPGAQRRYVLGFKAKLGFGSHQGMSLSSSSKQKMDLLIFLLKVILRHRMRIQIALLRSRRISEVDLLTTSGPLVAQDQLIHLELSHLDHRRRKLKISWKIFSMTLPDTGHPFLLCKIKIHIKELKTIRWELLTGVLIRTARRMPDGSNLALGTVHWRMTPGRRRILKGMTVELSVPFHEGQSAWSVLKGMANDIAKIPTSYLWDQEKLRIIQEGINFLMPYLEGRLRQVNP
jgi:hypothetical protein